MSCPIHANNRVHFVGDSITTLGWPFATGGFVDQVNAILAPSSIVTTTTGYSGEVLAQFVADMNTRVFAFNPDVIIAEIGTNDVNVGTDITAFQASLASFYSQVNAWKPGTPILWLSPMVWNEQWYSSYSGQAVATGGAGVVVGAGAKTASVAGPAWGPNIWDARFQSYVDSVKAAAATATMTSVDLRAAALAYEAAHNTPAIGAKSGVLTVDGVHPLTVGQVFMGTKALAMCTVS